MTAAVRLGDTSAHGGTVVGPGVASVLIGSMPAAVLGDLHACVLPGTHPPSSPFLAGSPTVLIQGRPALRTGDACGCGAVVVIGEPTVLVG